MDQKRRTPIKPGRSIGKSFVERNFFLFRLSSAERELRLDLPSQGRHQLGAPELLFLRESWSNRQFGRGVRLNTWPRIHYGKAAEDQKTAALIVLPKLFTGGEE
jgi:hypothetical protein